MIEYLKDIYDMGFTPGQFWVFIGLVITTGLGFLYFVDKILRRKGK